MVEFFPPKLGHILGKVYILSSCFSSNGFGFELIHLHWRVVPLGLTSVVLIWPAWVEALMEPNQNKQLITELIQELTSFATCSTTKFIGFNLMAIFKIKVLIFRDFSRKSSNYFFKYPLFLQGQI